jgi:hypothetical protein
MAAGLALAIGIAAAPAAAGSGWTSIGSARLDGAAASATAKLRWQAGFKELLVCAEGGAVKIGEATLRFADGTSRPLKLRTRLVDGGCLAELSVGKSRTVESMDIAYDPKSLAGAKTKITLAAR